MNRFKRWRHAHAHGAVYRVDPAPVLAHIRWLRHLGYSSTAIAAAAGVNTRTVSEMLRRDVCYVRASVATGILAVTPDQLHGVDQRSWVAKTGLVRRVHALQAIGWTYADLSRESGVNVYTAMRSDTEQVSLATFTAVREIYARLSMTPGPSELTRHRARVAGYAPPLAWDDTIDDPDAQPNLGELVPVKDPRQSEHTAAEAQFLLSCGVSLDQAARQLGVTRKYLTDTLPGRLGRREAS